MSLPRHGGQLQAIAARFGVDASQLADFSANLNPDGPPSGVRLALWSAIESEVALTQYPDLEETVLREAIAIHLGLPFETVIVGNGFVPLLEAIVATLKPGRCLVPVPCFNEYQRTLEQAGVAVVPFAISPDSGFVYDVDAILEAIIRERCDTLLLANPQNPSGVMADRMTMQRMIDLAAKHGVWVLVDEAFIDYEPEHSVVVEIAAQEHLIVFRSVTKFFALPGLRVAYAVVSGTYGTRVRERIAPWSITTLASVGVVAALCDHAYAIESRRRNLARREALRASLASLLGEGDGLRIFASRANFLLFQLPVRLLVSRACNTSDLSSVWERMLVRQKIVLRECGAYEGLCEGFYRVAVRNEGDNERLIEALRRELRS